VSQTYPALDPTIAPSSNDRRICSRKCSLWLRDFSDAREKKVYIFFFWWGYLGLRLLEIWTKEGKKCDGCPALGRLNVASEYRVYNVHPRRALQLRVARGWYCSTFALHKYMLVNKYLNLWSMARGPFPLEKIVAISQSRRMTIDHRKLESRYIKTRYDQVAEFRLSEFNDRRNSFG
jgi:hypothetical protein